MEAKGFAVPPPKEDPFDSNVITPGTPFMARLSEYLRWFVQMKQETDPGWRGIKVVFSDASVPGEGEHKIVEYIRRWRASSEYSPAVSHAICGQDADLMMLGLALHDPNVIAFLLQPELYRGRLINVEIETQSELTRGMTVADWWRVTGRDANVLYLKDVDVDGYWSLLLERLATLR